MPCGYCRHPSSAAWIPAPRGGRLPLSAAAELVRLDFRGNPRFPLGGNFSGGPQINSYPCRKKNKKRTPLVARFLVDFCCFFQSLPSIILKPQGTVDRTVPIAGLPKSQLQSSQKSHFLQKMPLRAPEKGSGKRGPPFYIYKLPIDRPCGCYVINGTISRYEWLNEY